MGYKNPDKKTLEKFDRIDAAMKKILYQIEDVLDFVRESKLQLKRIAVGDIIKSTIAGMDLPKDVKVKISEQKVVVNCDARKIEAVITNIVTNASQAMEGKGEIKIKVFGR